MNCPQSFYVLSKEHKSIFWSINAVSEKTTFLIMYWRLNFWSICQHYIHPSLFPVIHSPWLAPLSWVGGGTTRWFFAKWSVIVRIVTIEGALFRSVSATALSNPKTRRIRRALEFADFYVQINFSLRFMKIYFELTFREFFRKLSTNTARCISDATFVI
jgi:hypothetical protein